MEVWPSLEDQWVSPHICTAWCTNTWKTLQELNQLWRCRAASGVCQEEHRALSQFFPSLFWGQDFHNLRWKNSWKTPNIMIPMVVKMARLNMRLLLKVQTLSPGSLPVYPSLTLSTAVLWKLRKQLQIKTELNIVSTLRWWHQSEISSLHGLRHCCSRPEWSSTCVRMHSSELREPGAPPASDCRALCCETLLLLTTCSWRWELSHQPRLWLYQSSRYSETRVPGWRGRWRTIWRTSWFSHSTTASLRVYNNILETALCLCWQTCLS